MRVIEPSIEIIDIKDGQEILKKIEKIGRVCYKSEDKITDTSAEKFCKRFIDMGHESVIEHESITVKITCDRGVSHEIVRHRIAAYSQESTRYCNYSKDKFDNQITVIRPCYLAVGSESYAMWYESCKQAEGSYFDMLDFGCSPEEARAVLPTSLKTELVMTANLREWRHFLELRTDTASHPQMQQIANMILTEFKNHIPVFFDDIGERRDDL